MSRKNKRFEDNGLLATLPMPEQPSVPEAIVPPAEDRAPSGTSYLSESEQQEIKQREQYFAQIKNVIGDLSLQILNLEQQRAQKAAEYTQSHQLYNQRIGEIARAHGIDPNGSVKWSIDLTTSPMGFQRQG